MRTKTKTVYYCDFCKKNGLQKKAMEKHERHCTMNPERDCKWGLLEEGPRTRYDEHHFRKGLPRWVRLRAPLDVYDIAELRERAGYCPACMLAALRQSGVEYHYDYSGGAVLFSYEQEVNDYRKHEQEQALREELYGLQYGWT